MIGRTLDKILDLPQEIATSNRLDSFGKLIHSLKGLVLPVKRLELKGEGYLSPKDMVEYDGWSQFGNWKESELKRNLAKVFENRRKVNVGESFKGEDRYNCGFGSEMREYDVNRVDKNTILFNDYVISTNEKQLVKYAKQGLTPIHYSGVIF
jgi:hypothetical protein